MTDENEVAFVAGSTGFLEGAFTGVGGADEAEDGRRPERPERFGHSIGIPGGGVRFRTHAAETIPPLLQAR